MFMKLILVIIIASAFHLIKRKWLSTESKKPAQARKPMSISRVDALATLGLQEPVTEEDVIAAHKRLISRVHPDKGGTAFLAQQLNTARDHLLEELK